MMHYLKFYGWDIFLRNRDTMRSRIHYFKTTKVQSLWKQKEKWQPQSIPHTSKFFISSLLIKWRGNSWLLSYWTDVVWHLNQTVARSKISRNESLCNEMSNWLLWAWTCRNQHWGHAYSNGTSHQIFHYRGVLEHIHFIKVCLSPNRHQQTCGCNVHWKSPLLTSTIDDRHQPSHRRSLF